MFTSILFITLRNVFYTYAYPIGSLGTGVGALAVFSLAGAIMNVFMTSFNSIAIMSSIFVGQEFGKGNLKQARKNSDELKGFNLLISLVFATLAIIFALILPSINFLSKDQYKDGQLVFDSHAQIKQISYSIIVMSSFYPLWT